MKPKTTKKENNALKPSDFFFTFLALIFIFLKLFPGSPVNDWHWIWVLSPLWGPPVAGLLIFLVTFFVIIVSRIFLRYFGVK